MMGFSPGRFPSPLRYPGGKGKIANFFKLLFLQNKLVGVDYVEPYAGGAGVALSLLYEDYVEHIHINDINDGVYAFWAASLHRTADLCELIRERPVTMDEWHRQRDVQQSAATADPLELAFSTFFLNRVNRSGIISGGIIGGKDQAGAWKLDARYNRDDLVDRVRKVGRFASRISLTKLDAATMLEAWASDTTPALLYLDPPYYVKGEGLYDNFYEHGDHAAIAGLVARLRHPWVVSYDANPSISELYAGQRGIAYSLSYSAQARYRGSEVMYFSPGLTLPEEPPTKVPTERIRAAFA